MKQPGILVAGALLVGAMVASAPAARAQSEGDGFLFGRPQGSVGLRLGFDQALVGGDLYSYFNSDFTLSRRNFGAVDVAGDLAFALNPRVDLLFGLGFSGSEARSEYRNWLDNFNLPIRQTTALARVPLTASVKWYLAPQGRAIGRFAWVPGGVTPYVGAGVGLIWYQVRQWGDFINFADSSVMYDELSSAGWALSGHAFAGFEVPIGPRWAVTAEARYTYAQGGVGGDFKGYNGIDLSGVAVTAGLAVRF